MITTLLFIISISLSISFYNYIKILYWRPKVLKIPLFEIAVNPTVHISEIKGSRFYIVDKK